MRAAPFAWIVLGVVLTPPLIADDINFDRDVAPILAVHCLECHNDFDKTGGLDLSAQATTLTGGDSGRALVSGKLDESLLWQRVSEDEMPPEEPLSGEDKATLRRWIEGGAAWGTDPIDPFLHTSPRRAGYDWWSLQPIERSPLPVVEGESHSPIDPFILRKLHAVALSPSPQADRRTLIRRLSFDLTGLPPTPQAVDDFINDASPDAYEQLADRLLASPAYGERWGRHWLDIVRFGESQGFERDKLRENSWRYRDWVVRAFNADLPYDQFVRMQLAGDVLDGTGPEGVVATGFLVAGPWDEVGQKQQSAAMKKVVRQDELEDYISAVGQTFLGLTINCARCHDHKFDPVRQSEYYQLAAALNGVKHGDRNLDGIPTDAAAIQGMLASIEAKLNKLEQPVHERLLAARKDQPLATTAPEPLLSWNFDTDLSTEVGLLPTSPQGTAVIHEQRLRVDGRTGYATTGPLEYDLTEKTLEVWLRLETLQQRGGGAISVQTLDGATFDAIVFGEREPLQWMAGSNSFARYQSFGGPDETAAEDEFVHIAIVWHADGTIAAYRNGLPYGKPYKSSGPVTFAKGESQILFGLRHTPPGGNRFLSAFIDQARVYDRALTADEVAASAGVTSEHVSEEQLTAALSSEDRALRKRWTFEATHLRKQQTRAAATDVYAVTPEPRPDTMHVMLRGNPSTPGEAVTPGGVAAIVTEAADFHLPDDASDGQRRQSLAEWITRDDNPLFARVMVNRLWQYHFGVGFVPTPSDLGFNGGQPSHPQLLDWLAAEFIHSGYSVKHMHRLIVTSATYRQSSRPRDEALAIDAQNRWLWRMSPQRLEAESVRDAILAITNQLNAGVGGPGYYDFTTFTRNTQFYELLDPIGASFNRRSLYRCWVRSGRSPFLDVFDCPDPSTKTPRRAVTTTPLQSLALMNNSFVLRMSERLADLLEQQHPGDIPAQIDEAFRRAWGRPATTDEMQQTTAFIDAHGLAAFCRVLFNTNEFLYVE